MIIDVPSMLLPRGGFPFIDSACVWSLVTITKVSLRRPSARKIVMVACIASSLSLIHIQMCIRDRNWACKLYTMPACYASVTWFPWIPTSPLVWTQKILEAGRSIGKHVVLSWSQRDVRLIMKIPCLIWLGLFILGRQCMLSHTIQISKYAFH